MGEVYRARDTKLNRDVALKVLPSAFAPDPNRRARFDREAQILASLNHPNIAARRYIRIYDRQRGVGTNVTTSGREDSPVWSRDGKNIAYVSKDGESYSLYETSPGGSTAPRQLLTGARLVPTDYSSDSRHLLFMTFEGGPPRIGIYDRIARRATIKDNGAEAQYSPDGTWLAFAAAPSEVFVQAVGGGPRVQISAAGGGQPRWSRDGKRLFYLTGDRKMMEVSIGVQDGQLVASAPRPLFQTHVVTPWFALFQYDVTEDASRFIVNSLRAEAPLTLISNWPERLRR